MKCQSGFYSSTGNISCHECPAGYQCVYGKTPVICHQGEYAPVATETCLDCPAGYKCPGIGMSTPTICENGYYTNSIRQINCVACEAGQSCLSGNSSEICLPGTYSPGGVLDCLPCPSRTFSSSGSSVCAPCPAGKFCYSPAADPDDCPKGYFANLGDGNCSKCLLGYTSFLDNTRCVPCSAGFYCPDPGYVIGYDLFNISPLAFFCVCFLCDM